MAVGKSRRIVIDVDDVDLKRNLHSVLAGEGRSLKDWFSAAANQYLNGREVRVLAAEPRSSYGNESVQPRNLSPRKEPGRTRAHPGKKA